MAKVEDFDTIKIRLASPQEILSWSHGEVTKPETINYRTQRPEKDGLFCEKIFGPTRDYECYCGKYHGVRYKGVVCDKCGVEVTKSSVRRERLGHIKLASPVVNIWFLRGVPSRIGLLLSRSMQQIEKVVYFMSYIIVEVDEEAKKKILSDIQTEFDRKKKGITKEEKQTLKEEAQKAKDELAALKKGTILSENDYQRFSLKYGECFWALTGAEAIKKLLEEIDLQKLEKELEVELEKSSSKKQVRQRLSLVRSMIHSGVKPEWMCFTFLPVLPPDLRPMVQLDGGRYASSDLNDLYRRVINRNNRLKYLKEIGAPEVIVRNEKRMLQEAVDALIDNSARKSQMVQAPTGGKRQLKSLADILRGKQGRFRQNLLGKRVDYSGRAVIVVGPELKIEEVGFPKKMALELFKPFVINKIIERGLAHNVKAAGILISEERKEVWEILEEIIQGKYVLLNRAPTLHRLSIQAFRPVLIEGQAIQLHPLVCPAFNADFDGDQMAVHLPLSKKAQEEARNLMISSKGILKPATGQPIAVPRQEMVLGCYFLTNIRPEAKGEGKIFSNEEEAKLAYAMEKINVQAKIKVRIKKEGGKLIETSVGRVIFNDALPEDFPYQNNVQNSKSIQKLLAALIEKYDQKIVISIIDKLKNLGFEYATLSANTWGIDDLVIPKEKTELIKEAELKEENIKEQYKKGFLSETERKTKIIEVWQEVKDKISKLVPETLPKFGSVYAIIESGSRGSWSQPSQMAGMKGLVTNPSGEIIELPVKRSYKEGLTTLEYFISTHGARKGTADTALRTSSAGYLTRRLIDASHELIIREKDCGDKKGIIIDRKDAEEINQDFSQKLIGRIILEDIKDGDKIIIKKGELIDKKTADFIEKSGIQKVRVRSPLSCQSQDGICQMCYGSDLTTHQFIQLGQAIGVIAAQAIGEPGTQLTMRTFHTGGVAGAGDITLGLPRVEELFEARPPKGEAAIFEEKGKVEKVVEEKGGMVVIVKTEKGEKKEYHLPVKSGILVKKGEEVLPGQPIFEGRINLQSLFKAVGIRETQKYILKEVQRVYVGEGVTIHDKHIETIISQMFSRLKITRPGDSRFTQGEVIPKLDFFEENEKLRKAGKEEAKGKPILLGLTKVALSTSSFLSAASFQETSRVLIKAALEGQEDKLRGLKENVIIGKLIPAGTGFKLSHEKEKQFPEKEKE
ncbi:MAG TPA: DNA-directed RNA polymerase subunit beta' [Candidatus Pacearchaeota archaeon]|nr:DNA-directed RNA polymerase subunit beta' [Candidatus Pacearchaeota archaeon]HOK94353.1 DNA-directed RNA polymerase subunit beta' [Candidatus Pacearchaeota archaeon]HPO75458.1 DNA-directed RNA polymerase subunit beta' [Candidatus Pacearchaeota archaeon]